jgi:hypothetical protein
MYANRFAEKRPSKAMAAVLLAQSSKKVSDTFDLARTNFEA